MIALPRQQLLLISTVLTAVIFILVGPISIPGLDILLPKWRDLTAVSLLLIQWLLVGWPYLRAAFRRPQANEEISLFFMGWALLLCLIGNGVAYWQYEPFISTDPAQFHWHSTSFLLSFHLLLRFLLRQLQRFDQAQAEANLNLTPLMKQTVEQAEKNHPPILHRVLKRTPWIHVSYMIAAGLCALGVVGWTGQIQTGLFRAATVLATCSPLILVYSIPASFWRALRVTAAKNILVSNSTAIEMATRINALVFGKRGTLTQGAPRVSDVIPASGIDEEELLLWAASAEHNSQHPFGRAIVAEAAAQAIPLEPPERFLEMSGQGVECVIDGEAVRLGKPAFFDKKTIPGYLGDRLAQLALEGKTPFMCCRNNDYLGIIGVTEEVRPEAAAAIESIRALGYRTIMMTGDDQMMSETLAEQLHIDQVVAEVLSKKKPNEINRLRREGFRLGMVGEFPEDIPCFNEAELGITLTRGSGRELPPTDIILLEDNLERVVSALEICRTTMHVARENRLFSYLYHMAAGLFSIGALVPFGFAPPGPIAGSLLSGLALSLALLNIRRINFTH